MSGSCGTRGRCSHSSIGASQSRSVPATSGRPSDPMPTVYRSNCETHRRVGQVPRSGSDPCAGSSRSVETVATGSSSPGSSSPCDSTTCCSARRQPRSGTSEKFGVSVAGTVGPVRGRCRRSGYGRCLGDSHKETSPAGMLRELHSRRTD